MYKVEIHWKNQADEKVTYASKPLEYVEALTLAEEYRVTGHAVDVVLACDEEAQRSVSIGLLCREHNPVIVGMKHDTEKSRWDLLPFGVVGDIVRVLDYGAKKYAPENWRKVHEWRRRYFAATVRHLVAWWGGEKIDKESGLPHLAHAACSLLFMAELDHE